MNGWIREEMTMADASDFKYGDWELYDAIEGLISHEQDSTVGAKDEGLQRAVEEFLFELGAYSFQVVGMGYIHRLHCLRDVRYYLDWLQRRAGRSV